MVAAAVRGGYHGGIGLLRREEGLTVRYHTTQPIEQGDACGMDAANVIVLVVILCRKGLSVDREVAAAARSGKSIAAGQQVDTDKASPAWRNSRGWFD